MLINKKWDEVLNELLEELEGVADRFNVPVKSSGVKEKDHSFDKWETQYTIDESIFKTEIVVYSNLVDYHTVDIRETAYSGGKFTVLTNVGIKFPGNGNGRISL